jgi:hypothetical protein
LISEEGESVSERRDILVEHKMFLTKKMELFKNLLQLIEIKISFYDKTLNSEDKDTVKCMDYITEWEHFRTILGGIKYE